MIKLEDVSKRSRRLPIFRRILHELGQQQTSIDEKELTRAVAHVENVKSASVTAKNGALLLDVTVEEELYLSCSLIPLGAYFAPRGAKEIVFRVEPSDVLHHRILRDITSALTVVIARQLWAVALRDNSENMGDAIVDRDGTDCLRIDLRTIPGVRHALRRRTSATIIEFLELRDLRADDGELTLSIKLPSFGE